MSKNYFKIWKRARDALAKATQAEEVMMVAGRRHRSEHPLDEETVAAIQAAFTQGKPLCCETGLKTLYDIGLDECWIVYLNEWAYEYIGCSYYDRPSGTYYEQSLKKLHRKLKECV